MPAVTPERQSLLGQARRAAHNAYAPASGFRVGAVTVSGSGNRSRAGGRAPCGACRQVLHQFAPALKITYREGGDFVTRLLPELLLDAFGDGRGNG